MLGKEGMEEDRQRGDAHKKALMFCSLFHDCNYVTSVSTLIYPFSHFAAEKPIKAVIKEG